MSKKKKSWMDDLVPRPKSELETFLTEHLDVLQTLCAQYDQGKHHFSAEIALNLRVLLSDNPENGNRSLLHQLGLDSTDFVDTEKTMNEGDPNVFIAPASGLVFSTTLPVGAELVQHWEPNIGMLNYERLYTTSFKEWWEGPVLQTSSGDKFPRRRVIRNVANQDRGGHVSLGIEKAYFELTRKANYGYRSELIAGDAVTDPNAYTAPERVTQVTRQGSGGRLVRALVRQIAHETLLTLTKDPENYLNSIPASNPGIEPIMFVQYRKKVPKDMLGR